MHTILVPGLPECSLGVEAEWWIFKSVMISSVTQNMNIINSDNRWHKKLFKNLSNHIHAIRCILRRKTPSLWLKYP